MFDGFGDAIANERAEQRPATVVRGRTSMQAVLIAILRSVHLAHEVVSLLHCASASGCVREARFHER